jgi:DNA repair exonuclease SbcCD ATPase subunit
MLRDNFGVTKKQLDDYVFVGQRQIDALIDKAPNERGAELAVLFGTERASKICDAIGKLLRAVEVPVSATDVPALRQQLSVTDNSIAELERQLGELGAVPADIGAFCASRERVYSDWKAFVALRRGKLRAQRDRQRAKAALLVALNRKNALDADADTLQQAIDAAAAQLPAAHAELAAWRAYHEAQRAREQYAQQHARLFESWRNRPRWPAPLVNRLTSAEYSATTARIEELRSELRANESSIATLRSGTANTKCHACGQPLPGLEAKLNQIHLLTARNTLRAKELAPLQQQIQQQDAHAKLLGTVAAYNSQTRAALRALRAARQALAAVRPGTVPKAELDAIVGEHAEYVTALRELKPTQTAQHAQVATLRERVDALERNIQQSAADLQKRTPVPKQQVRTARAEIAAATAAAQARATLQARLASELSRRYSLQKQLQDAARCEQMAKSVRRAVAHLEAVRNIFRPNEAPRAVSFTYLEMLQDGINNMLQQFDSPFTVAPDDNFGFTATFVDDGRVVADRRLSVGERIVLSLAFRVVVNATFAGSLGLLVMDEPTAGLDEHNLDCLPRALESLREFSTQRGLQVLFVTHEPRVMQYFDHVITL